MTLALALLALATPAHADDVGDFLVKYCQPTEVEYARLNGAGQCRDERSALIQGYCFVLAL
ncbi:MAG: hypothetical protein EP330_22880 [Deltaproteobacteria bacterium]|nr:MAG: hypothetical protein EP330_22880 [Deltaproteobacteria bacterium]